MSNQTHKTRPYTACFVCLVGGDGAETRNTKNTPEMARFLCFVMVGGGELPKHKEHTLMGVFFLVWEEGMGCGAETRNTKNAPFRARSSCFVMVGRWRTSQTQRRGWGWRC